jgi:hypothetical protein
MILNMAYAVLSDVRPIFGCESCGTPSAWLRPIAWMIKWARALFGESHHLSPNFTPLPATGARIVRHPHQSATEG